MGHLSTCTAPLCCDRNVHVQYPKILHPKPLETAKFMACLLSAHCPLGAFTERNMVLEAERLTPAHHGYTYQTIM